MNDRVERLRRVFARYELEALLITKPENIYYLTGFTGGIDGRVLITTDQVFLATDRRYELQSSQECPRADIIIETGAGYKNLEKQYKPYRSLGVESHHLTWQEYLNLKDGYSGNVISCPHAVEELRTCKDDEELQRLRQAAVISDEIFAQLLHQIKPGLKEIDLAVIISHEFRVRGCSKEAFDTIVLTGAHAALPHGQPGGLQLAGGDMVTIDMGGIWQHYVSDMTRTVVLDKPSPRYQEIYHILAQAQQLGISLVKAGAYCQDIDAKIRAFLGQYHLREYFAHSSGHGIGLEIHEQPLISSRSETALKENMVITIEPGVYIPGWGGIRIEDSVIVTRQGCEVITKSPKELIIL